MDENNEKNQQNEPTVKAALCFIISYKHVLNKEHIWKEWIEPNKDIINVYFHYKDLRYIKSHWIRSHAIPQNLVVDTSYYHIVPAYMTLLSYGILHDSANKWFCFLTDSCVPIISPQKFRELFFLSYDYSILNWKKAWWNVDIHKRANLRLCPEKYRLGHDPWFILKRSDAIKVINFMIEKQSLYRQICLGGLANESIFAIILQAKDELKNVLQESSTLTNWSQMSSATSPYLFKHGTKEDIEFIKKGLLNKYSIFLRKVDTDFPDDILKMFIN
jgi:hypothetical protein